MTNTPETQYIGAGESSSDVVIHDSAVYLPAISASADLPTAAEQTNDILAQIDTLLASAGTSKRKMLSATIFCGDARLIEEVNTRWDAWVPWHDPPAITFLVVKLPSARRRVAIQITAGL